MIAFPRSTTALRWPAIAIVTLLVATVLLAALVTELGFLPGSKAAQLPWLVILAWASLALAYYALY